MSTPIPSGSPRPTPLVRWARFTVRFKWIMLLGAVLSIVGLVAIQNLAGGQYNDSFSIPGTESQDAYTLLAERFPAQSGDSANVIFKAADGTTLDDPTVKAQVDAVLAELGTLPHLTSIGNPYTDQGGITPDGDAAQTTLQFGVPATDIAKADLDRIVEIVTAANSDTLTVAAGGIVINQAEQKLGGIAELIGVGAAAIILLFSFGSVVGMGLPLVTALFGLGSGMIGLGIVTAFMDVSSFTPVIGAMVGLGVGTDYALFVVTRYRESLSQGATVEEAVVRAVDTAGRAVIFAGGVVVIALAGLVAIGMPFISAFGIGSAVVVFFCVVVALTVLPALLAIVGTRINRLSISRRKAPEVHSSPWGYRLAQAVQARPAFYAILSTLVLLLLSAPILGLKLGFPDAGANPPEMLSRQAYDLVNSEFGPGINGPFLIVVNNPSGLVQADLDSLNAALGATDGVVLVAPATANPANDTAVITLIPATGPSDDATNDLVHTLRDGVIPATVGTTSTIAYVGGQTATQIDLQERLAQRTPVFFAIVIGLSFLLLMTVFRSILVPLKAAIMNLFSIAAAFGVMTAVFQFGWGARFFGIESTGSIAAFMPMFLFSILFGLSMDYEVFLLSRIREAWTDHNDTGRAVSEGLAATARVITAAAAIMFAVFISFVFEGDPIPRQFGLGLAVAVLLDATIVRLILVPSTMALLGDKNWWLPGWLDRILPHVNIEGSPQSVHRTTAVEPPRTPELVPAD